jgi:hypothetical protein
MNRKALTVTAVLVGLSLILAGCVPVLLTGAVAGAGGYMWVSGKLSFTTPHTTVQCHKATVAALDELKIMITGEAVDMVTGKIIGKTSTGDNVTIDLEPMSADLTRVEIRVGYVGNRILSKMIADAIEKHLNRRPY